jgi:hypothetical protein
VLGGLADTRDLETVSAICGDVDIEVPGRTYNVGSEQTRNVSDRRVPAFTAGQVRTLRRCGGLLFYEELRLLRGIPGKRASVLGRLLTKNEAPKPVEPTCGTLSDTGDPASQVAGTSCMPTTSPGRAPLDRNYGGSR